MTEVDAGIAGVAVELQLRLDHLPTEKASRRAFLGTYQRTTIAIGRAVAAGDFEDPGWVSAWDVWFAGYFLTAHDADLASEPVVRPWRLAFDAAADRSDLVRILLALNAHINYDLPQAMIAMISAADFADPAVLARRHRDHERIDGVIGSRVSAETPDAAGRDGGLAPLFRRLLAPLNRWSSRRFLRLARRDVWHNVARLQQARLAGPAPYALCLGQLETQTADKITELLRPGPLLLRLAATGFGVRLPAG